MQFAIFDLAGNLLFDPLGSLALPLSDLHYLGGIPVGRQPAVAINQLLEERQRIVQADAAAGDRITLGIIGTANVDLVWYPVRSSQLGSNL